ncbi:hypothetical protein MRU69_00280 [Kocuria flava]|uniref:hypothetical protein n=1 Tax=Kocuria flava TaxID=446860 RepID=UPI000DD2FC0A|nr:hypothetical protein [Kocuria flava]MCJ8503301.1 hypothetical protein [Kocuria flava]
MPAPQDWPQRAWWSVLLLQTVSIFFILMVLRHFGLAAAIIFGAVVVVFEIWWQLGPFWTKAQRLQIRRRALERIDEPEK